MTSVAAEVGKLYAKAHPTLRAFANWWVGRFGDRRELPLPPCCAATTARVTGDSNAATGAPTGADAPATRRARITLVALLSGIAVATPSLTAFYFELAAEAGSSEDNASRTDISRLVRMRSTGSSMCDCCHNSQRPGPPVLLLARGRDRRRLARRRRRRRRRRRDGDLCVGVEHRADAHARGGRGALPQPVRRDAGGSSCCFPPHACPVGDVMISVDSRCKNVSCRCRTGTSPTSRPTSRSSARTRPTSRSTRSPGSSTTCPRGCGKASDTRAVFYTG